MANSARLGLTASLCQDLLPGGCCALTIPHIISIRLLGYATYQLVATHVQWLRHSEMTHNKKVSCVFIKSMVCITSVDRLTLCIYVDFTQHVMYIQSQLNRYLKVTSHIQCEDWPPASKKYCHPNPLSDKYTKN